MSVPFRVALFFNLAGAYKFIGKLGKTDVSFGVFFKPGLFDVFL